MKERTHKPFEFSRYLMAAVSLESCCLPRDADTVSRLFSPLPGAMRHSLTMELLTVHKVPALPGKFRQVPDRVKLFPIDWGDAL